MQDTQLHRMSLFIKINFVKYMHTYVYSWLPTLCHDATFVVRMIMAESVDDHVFERDSILLYCSEKKGFLYVGANE